MGPCACPLPLTVLGTLPTHEAALAFKYAASVASSQSASRYLVPANHAHLPSTPTHCPGPLSPRCKYSDSQLQLVTSSAYIAAVIATIPAIMLTDRSAGATPQWLACGGCPDQRHARARGCGW